LVRSLLLGAAIVVAAARPVTWTDFPDAIHARLQRAGVDASSFPGFLEQLNRTHALRVRAIEPFDESRERRGVHARLPQASVDRIGKIDPGDRSRRRNGNRGGDERAGYHINLKPS